MKKIYLAVVALLWFHVAMAQTTEKTASVEKSLFSAQLGVIGGFVNHEARLSNNWVLRSEIGLEMVFYEVRPSSSYGKSGALLTPSISVEPRWYYNLSKRTDKGRSIAGNSANFWALDIKYNPDLFTIGAPDDVYVPNQLSVIPKWGIRRKIGKSNFNYELGIGIGYLWCLDKEDYLDKGGVAGDLNIRIGYNF